METRLDELVATLRSRAQTALAVGKGRLLDASGGLLGDKQTVKDAKLEKKALLTLQLGRVQIAGFEGAVAAILSDGSLVTWGHEDIRRGRHVVQDQLDGVFAAILTDGLVVTWGDTHYGFDSSAAQEQVKGVQQIQSSRYAFAAIRRTDPLLLGATSTVVVTAVMCKTS